MLQSLIASRLVPVVDLREIFRQAAQSAIITSALAGEAQGGSLLAGARGCAVQVVAPHIMAQWQRLLVKQMVTSARPAPPNPPTPS